MNKRESSFQKQKLILACIVNFIFHLKIHASISNNSLALLPTSIINATKIADQSPTSCSQKGTLIAMVGGLFVELKHYQVNATSL